jgi:peptidoglycan/xylan/chitin deacetylase (PgdA/CDA1 family)
MYFGCDKPGLLALTYDDGPSRYTETLLDTLKENNVKATFFIVGVNIKTNRERDILKRIYNEGHLIASHTWSHQDLRTLSDWRIREEMTKTDDVIFDVLGGLILKDNRII